MTSTLTIRAAGAADLPTIADLWCALQRLHEPFHGCWAVTPRSRDHYLRALRATFDDDRTVLRVVADSSGQVVGYCHGRVATLPDHASERFLGVIESIHVEPPSRDGGIGSALLSAVADELRRLGAERLEVTVSADNDGAIRFLERARFCLHTVTLSREV